MVALLAALAAFIWVTLLVVTPLLPAWAGAALYGVGSLICHQIPERSFYAAGFQLPVCARCLGIYLGVACGAALSLMTVTRTTHVTSTMLRKLAVAGALPTIVTVALESAGVWFPSNLTRAIAGLSLGVIVGVVVANAQAGTSAAFDSRSGRADPSTSSGSSRAWSREEQSRGAPGPDPTLHYDECVPPRPTVPRRPPPSI